jgi:hypothetical protein
MPDDPAVDLERVDPVVDAVETFTLDTSFCFNRVETLAWTSFTGSISYEHCVFPPKQVMSVSEASE